jgi:phage gp36-like protein
MGNPQSPPYVTPAQLPLYGANPAALIKISNDIQVAACQAATDTLDAYFRARYPLPFLAVNDTAIALRAAHIATWLLLSQKGRNPGAGYDDQIDMRYAEAIEWAKGVERQSIHLNVTVASQNPPRYNLPTVYTAPQRGWSGRVGPAGWRRW